MKSRFINSFQRILIRENQKGSSSIDLPDCRLHLLTEITLRRIAWHASTFLHFPLPFVSTLIYLACCQIRQSSFSSRRRRRRRLGLEPAHATRFEWNSNAPLETFLRGSAIPRAHGSSLRRV